MITDTLTLTPTEVGDQLTVADSFMRNVHTLNEVQTICFAAIIIAFFWMIVQLFKPEDL